MTRSARPDSCIAEVLSDRDSGGARNGVPESGILAERGGRVTWGSDSGSLGDIGKCLGDGSDGGRRGSGWKSASERQRRAIDSLAKVQGQEEE